MDLPGRKVVTILMREVVIVFVEANASAKESLHVEEHFAHRVRVALADRDGSAW